MVKNVIALTLSLLISLGFFNGYQWYCGELIFISDLYTSIFSICTLIYILNSMIIVGIFINLTKYSYKKMLIIIFSFIFLKIGMILINSGLSINYVFDIFLAYFGKFLGVFLGIIYFKQVKSVKKALLFLILLWLLINIIYPLIK